MGEIFHTGRNPKEGVEGIFNHPQRMRVSSYAYNDTALVVEIEKIIGENSS
jgi:hypothetical protein